MNHCSPDLGIPRDSIKVAQVAQPVPPHGVAWWVSRFAARSTRSRDSRAPLLHVPSFAASQRQKLAGNLKGHPIDIPEIPAAEAGALVVDRSRPPSTPLRDLAPVCCLRRDLTFELTIRRNSGSGASGSPCFRTGERYGQIAKASCRRWYARPVIIRWRLYRRGDCPLRWQMTAKFCAARRTADRGGFCDQLINDRFHRLRQ